MKAYRIIVIVLIVANLLVLSKYWKASDLIEDVSTRLQLDFKGDILEFIYLSQLNMVTGEGDNSEMYPEIYRKKISYTLDVLTHLESSTVKGIASELESRFSMRKYTYKDLSTLEDLEYINQIINYYPLTFATYQSGITKLKKSDNLELKFQNFKEDYILASDQLSEYRDKNGDLTDINITIMNIDGKVLFSGKTKDFMFEEKRSEITQILKTQMTVSKEGSISELIWIIKLF